MESQVFSEMPSLCGCNIFNFKDSEASFFLWSYDEKLNFSLLDNIYIGNFVLFSTDAFKQYGIAQKYTGCTETSNIVSMM